MSGVSVYNGRQWRQYGPIDGPLGTRLFALAVSPKDGGVWGATEAGLFRYQGERWTYYTRADGLPSDQAQALAFAPDGTLYVGTQCDGIAVGSPANDYKTWRVTAGPRQMPSLPEGDGLPTGLINSLLVARSGTVYAGTTEGLAQSHDAGRTWRYTRGADWLDKANGRFRSPDLIFKDNPKISGLEIIPAAPRPGQKPVAIAAGSAVAVGAFAADHDVTGGGVSTLAGPVVDIKGVARPAPAGVYRSERTGSFAYLIPGLTPRARYRVRLHFAEVFFTEAGKRVFGVLLNGQTVLSNFDIVAAAGGANKAVVKEFPAQADFRGQILIQSQGGAYAALPNLHLLSEDYVTSLAEDGAGHLLVGHWRTGLELWDETREARLYPAAKDIPAADYVSALLPLRDGGALVARNGSGLARQDIPSLAAPKSGALPVAEDAIPDLPLPARPPTAAELSAMLARVRSLKDEMPVGGGAYLGEDWRTLGDWVGRYGRKYAVLCAIASPLDQVLTWDTDYNVEGQIGPNHGQDEALRHWLQPGMVNTSRLASLYSPIDGFRAQAEWDDHGETYPQTYEGPDVWMSVTVPEGVHQLSLYDTNKDAHSWDGNRHRDYLVDLLPYRAKVEDSMNLPPLAHARIHSFWNGLYASFLVRGPAKFRARVAKNGSTNTILTGVFIDKLVGPRAMTDNDPLAGLNGVQYDPPNPAVSQRPSNLPPLPPVRLSDTQRQTLAAARSLWTALTPAYDKSGSIALQQPYRMFSYRAAMANGGTEELGKNWRWRLHLWTDEDRVWFDRMMQVAAREKQTTAIGIITR